MSTNNNQTNVPLDNVDFLKVILELAPGHMYWKNLKGEFQGCNHLQAIDAGFSSSAAIVGKTDYDMPWREDADFLRAVDAQVIKTGQSIIIEEKSKTFSGKDAIWLSRKEPLRDTHGIIVGIIGVSIDITEQKEKERLELENYAHRITAQEQAKFQEIVKQVSHDIRSPLAGLQLTLDDCVALLSEKHRNLCNIAIGRLTDIANQMLNYFAYGNTLTGILHQQVDVLINAELLEVIQEKKHEHSKQKIQFVNNIQENAPFVFIHVDRVAFRQTMSNIINNAVDAITEMTKQAKQIVVDLLISDTEVTITITDNGKGMPESVREKILNDIAVTDGKDDGHGIGFEQIRNMLNHNNGTLAIESTVGSGTKIMLTFSRVTTPNWIVDKIELSNNSLIVILDDESSIHAIWDGKITNIMPDAEIHHFNNGRETIVFINQLEQSKRSKVFLLADHTLLKQDVNGFDVIRQTQIDQSILVTNYYNNKDIIEQAELVHTKVLPKPLAAIVPIVVTSTKNVATKARENTRNSHLKTVDVVVVDDDKQLVGNLQLFMLQNKKADLYYSAREFLNTFMNYSRDTLILVDNQFKNENIEGIKVIQQLYAAGFTNYYLYSGMPFRSDELPSYIKAIMKDDIDTLGKLLNL